MTATSRTGSARTGRARLLDRPEVIKALGTDTISDAREALES